MVFNKYFILILIVISNLIAFSEESIDSTDYKKFTTVGVSIISDKSNLIKSIPGSASFIEEEQLKVLRGISGNQILRNITGINVVDEEGMGLRMNLGIRGLDPDRSRSLLVLEDGIPVALAPYGEPELYYTPSIDRMKSIEILKGSGSIVYGPQTIGGVLNYITNDPPISEEIDLRLIGGSNGFINSKFAYGNSFSGNGFLVEFHHKSADKIGITQFSVNDFMIKTKLKLNSTNSIRIKVAVYDELSNSTYVGLTQPMYDNHEYFKIIAPEDQLQIRRYSTNLIYQAIIGNSSVLNFTLYGYNTQRDWKRQDFGRLPDVSNRSGVIFGDTSKSGGAIYMRNSTGNRNREFDVMGAQLNFITSYSAFGYESELNTGLNCIYEKAFEQRINGTDYKSLSGNLIEDESRTGNAFSAYIQDKFFINEQLIITPGIRFEYFDYKRNIYRFASNDTNLIAGNSISELIPGIGINFNLNKSLTLYTGLHRGFSPPRTKDAISNEAIALDLSAELSWNYEMGIRTNISNNIYGEFTLYLLDFANQIIPVSESSGGAGYGLVNGGRTIHQGIEISLMAEFLKLSPYDNSLVWSINCSWGTAKYSDDRYIASDSKNFNVKDNTLPYAPNFTISSLVHYNHINGFGFSVNFTYIGSQFSDELNTILPSNDGTIGLIDPYYLVDMSVFYNFLEGIETFISFKNLLNQKYISSRRPQGIKVGIPSQLIAGIDWHF